MTELLILRYTICVLMTLFLALFLVTIYYYLYVKDVELDNEKLTRENVNLINKIYEYKKLL